MPGRTIVRKQQAVLFGDRLKYAIAAKGTSARGLATEMGVDESMISHMIKGRRTPCLENLRRLVNALRLDSSEGGWLVTGGVKEWPDD